MSLNLGTLVAYIKGDRSSLQRELVGARADMAGFSRDANGRLHDLEGKFVAEGKASGEGWRKEVQRGLEPIGGVLTKVGGWLKALGPAALQGAKISLVGAAAISTVTHLHALLGALAPVSGALLAIPGLVTTAAVAMVVWKLGAKQLGETIKATTLPALEELQGIAGRELTAGMERGIQRLVRVWLPTLRTGVKGISHELNGALLAAVAFASTWGAVSDWSIVISHAQQAAAYLHPVLADVLSVITDISQVGSALLPDVARGLGNMADKAKAFVADARADGRLFDWTQAGIATIRELGSILTQIGGIIHAVFNAGATSGGGLLSVVEKVATQVNKFLSSDVGQSALTALFTAADQVVSTGLLPALLTLAGGVATAVVPALVSIGTALAPVLPMIASGLVSGLQALAPAIGPLATAAASVLAAMTPLLPIVGKLAAIVATQLATTLSVLAAVLAPILVQLAGHLSPVLTTIAGVAVKLGQALEPVAVQLGQKLGGALQTLLPKLADIAIKIIDSLLPYLPQLVESFGQVAMVIAQMAIDAVPPLVKILDQLAPYIPDLVKASMDLLIVILALLPVFLQVILWITGIVKWLQLFAWGLEVAIGGVKNMIKVGKAIVEAFAGAGTWLVDAGKSIIRGLLDGIDVGVKLVKRKMADITDMIPRLKGPEEVDRRLLYGAGRLIMGGLRMGIDAEVPGLRAQLNGITGQVAAAGGRAGGGSGSGAGGGAVHTILIKGDGLLSGLREVIQIKGGDVQRVLGATP